MGDITQFGQLCRMCRFPLNLSQANVADRVGKSQAYVSNVERGKTDPPWDYLVKSMELYNIKQEAEQLRFVTCAFLCSKHIDFPIDTATILPKEILARLLTCLALNIEKPKTPDMWFQYPQWGIELIKRESEKQSFNNGLPWT